MVNLQKFTENRGTFFLFPLDKTLNDRTAYLDATDTLHDAIRSDRKKGYEDEKGPAFAIEALRAREYADYVSEYATSENLQRFDTKRYYFYTNSLTVDQVESERVKSV
jgi:hypothetical protein